MAIGFGMFLGLMAVEKAMKNTHELEPVKQASHPIVEQIAAGDIGIIIFVLLTACIGAPIIEETVFRGVLYRHLREMSLKTKRWISVIMATLVNSFIFAAIHPQGWTAIPVLAALAVGFSWAREWRGSLVAPMTMHAMNNGFIGLLMLTFML
jgi:membrane protease YdiL (CAAX protease family)